MTPEKARYVGRAYKALADSLAAVEPGEAGRAERQSLWWMSYAISLGTTKPEGDPP
jgi:hypothetical protein